MPEYRLAYLERIKSGLAKKTTPSLSDKNTKSHTYTKTDGIEAVPSQPYILDEGGVPRYQLPTEKNREQTIRQVEQT